MKLPSPGPRRNRLTVTAIGIVMLVVFGVTAAVLLNSWLVVGALVLALAAWVARFIVLYRL